jgi:hypothetical protein
MTGISLSSTRCFLLLALLLLVADRAMAQSRVTRMYPDSGFLALTQHLLTTKTSIYRAENVQRDAFGTWGAYISRHDRNGRLLWRKQIQNASAVVIWIIGMFDDSISNGVECVVQLNVPRIDDLRWMDDIRIDSSGSVISERVYLMGLFLESAAKCSDGGLAVVGNTGNGSGEIGALIRLDSSGYPIWMRTNARLLPGYEHGPPLHGVMADDRGEVVTYGAGRIGSSYYSGVAFRFDRVGTELFHRQYAGPSKNSLFITDACRMRDGTIALGGQLTDSVANAIVMLVDGHLQGRWGRILDAFGDERIAALYQGNHGMIGALLDVPFYDGQHHYLAEVGDLFQIDSLGTIVDAVSVSPTAPDPYIPMAATPLDSGCVISGYSVQGVDNNQRNVLTILDQHDSSCMISGLSYNSSAFGKDGNISLEYDTTIQIFRDTGPLISLVDAPVADRIVCDAGPFPGTPMVSVPSRGLEGLYPNPCIRAIQDMRLRLSDPALHGTYVAFIRNEFGAIIREDELSIGSAAQPIQIVIDGLAAGAYQLELFDSSQTTLVWRGAFMLE